MIKMNTFEMAATVKTTVRFLFFYNLYGIWLFVLQAAQLTDLSDFDILDYGFLATVLHMIFYVIANQSFGKERNSNDYDN